MKCGQRLLSVMSLGFGLVATGTLALAVATDYWLYTTEPMVQPSYPSDDGGDLQNYLNPGLPTGDNETGGAYIDEDILAAYPDLLDLDYVNVSDSDYDIGSFQLRAHSGLWRMCLYYEDPVPPMCWPIHYFGQDWQRVQDADATWSILRAIRKASPVIVFSLLLLIIAFALSTIGNTHRDLRTISGAMLYAFAALCLAVGVIIYISAVNDEVAHRKKPNPDGSVFQYRYGWAFFFASASFVASLMASVSNISLYLNRFPTIEDMAGFIPGLDKKHNYTFTKVVSELESSEVQSCSQNPTLIL